MAGRKMIELTTSSPVARLRSWRPRLRSWRHGWGRALLFLYTGLVIAGLLLPLIVVIPLSFTSDNHLIFPPPGWSVQWYRSLFTSAEWLNSMLQSLQIAVVCMLVSTIVGTLAAFPLVRRDFRGRLLLLIFIASPLIVPEIAVAIGLFFVALSVKLTDQWVMVALGESIFEVPITTLVVAAALRNFDQSLEDAAMSLGASPLRVLRYVTLPSITPAIVTAMAFSFIFSLNDLLIPLFLGSLRVVPLPIRIWSEIRSSVNLTVLAVSVVWFVAAFLILLVVQMAARRLQAKAGIGAG